ncbi:hypothetical protein C5167_024770 [Papaver somniferum]|uniref:Uncharacterized protein n=1 Tax=Papaver somniferum TaxID=3469 RepID=A0A4Y7JTA1_PAPSO|nr:hypothetical protein C5167_024770 [Papaver somniferum]
MAGVFQEQVRTKKSVAKDENKTTGNPAGPFRRSTRLRNEVICYQEQKLVVPRLRRGIAATAEKSYPLRRAEIFRSSLSSENPSCVKPLDHELDDGDAIVLELIQPRRLKVHVFRLANGSSEAKAKEIKQSRENELVTKVKDSDADEDMVEVDAEQISKPRERRTRRNL